MLVVVRAFDRSLLHTRRVWQVWTHSFCICRRGFDSVPGGANSLLDFLFSRGERIVRHVHRFVLDFGFDYAVQSQDRVGDFPFAGGISELLNFNPSGHGFAQTRIGTIRFFVHVLLKVFVRGAMNSCIRDAIVTFSEVLNGNVVEWMEKVSDEPYRA